MAREMGVAGEAGDALAMRSAGALAYIEAEIDGLEAELAALPDWAPARALAAEARWVRDKVRALAESWDRKLVVAIAGPSGAGKSTLLNALAGRVLSPTGLQRPTTRQVVVYAAARSDADPLVAALDEGSVVVHVAPDARALDQIILVDTPDTNTLPENQRLLATLLEHADLVLAVFAAQNPKLQDNLAFLAPFVRHLPAEAVIPVLNMVDRVPPDQLDEIVADFRGALARNWALRPERIYRISALAPFSGPEAGDERPLHALNELPQLEEFVGSALNRSGEVIDRRLAHAEHLVALLQAHVEEAVSASAGPRRAAREALGALRRDARSLLEATLGDEAAQEGSFAVNVALYQHLSGRWWGPVGWLVAVWAFLLRVGGFLGRLGRAERPLGEAGGSPPRHAASAAGTRLERLYAERWPVVAEALVSAGFQATVRDGERWRAEVRALHDDLSARGAAIYREEVARLAGRLSAWPLQVLLNAPVIGTAGWIAYDATVGFYLRRFLPAAYFQHAGVAALAAWLGGFLVLQAVASIAARGALRRRVASAVADSVAGQQLEALWGQIERLEALAGGSRAHAGSPTRQQRV